MAKRKQQEIALSRSEKKRQAKNVEHLATELVNLGAADIKRLPCDEFIRAEIKDCQQLKSGARKRQLKYITKILRGQETEALLRFLEEQKGSKLKQKTAFHELERMRDEIISEIIEFTEAYEGYEQTPPLDTWQGQSIEEACSLLPNLDKHLVRSAAYGYGLTRNPKHSKEIFRLLKAAQDQLELQAQLTKGQDQK